MLQTHLSYQSVLLRIHSDGSECGMQSWEYLLPGPVVGGTQILDLSLKNNLILVACQIGRRSGEEVIGFLRWVCLALSNQCICGTINPSSLRIKQELPKVWSLPLWTPCSVIRSVDWKVLASPQDLIDTTTWVLAWLRVSSRFWIQLVFRVALPKDHKEIPRGNYRLSGCHWCSFLPSSYRQHELRRHGSSCVSTSRPNTRDDLEVRTGFVTIYDQGLVTW